MLCKALFLSAILQELRPEDHVIACSFCHTSESLCHTMPHCSGKYRKHITVVVLASCLLPALGWLGLIQDKRSAAQHCQQTESIRVCSKSAELAPSHILLSTLHAACWQCQTCLQEIQAGAHFHMPSHNVTRQEYGQCFNWSCSLMANLERPLCYRPAYLGNILRCHTQVAYEV